MMDISSLLVSGPIICLCVGFTLNLHCVVSASVCLKCAVRVRYSGTVEDVGRVCFGNACS